MEFEFISWLRERLPSHPLLQLSLGDDTAWLRLRGVPDYLVTVDLIADGVHFLTSEHSPQAIGHKALAVNLSDIAAMAGKPLAAVVAILLPRQGGLQLAQGIYEGMLPLAEKYQVAIAGGDTNTWNGSLAISVTVIGQARACGPLCRHGAKPGDRILVTGSLGGSLSGKHLEFEPRLEEAQFLHMAFQLSAGIDISDGLTADLSHILEESQVGAVLDLARIPISEAAKATNDGKSPLEHALSDGEDFELLLTAPAEKAEKIVELQPLTIPVTDIGEIVAKRGLWARDAAGNQQPLIPAGFRHAFDDADGEPV